MSPLPVFPTVKSTSEPHLEGQRSGRTWVQAGISPSPSPCLLFVQPISLSGVTPLAALNFSALPLSLPFYPSAHVEAKSPQSHPTIIRHSYFLILQKENLTPILGRGLEQELGLYCTTSFRNESFLLYLSVSPCQRKK